MAAECPGQDPAMIATFEDRVAAENAVDALEQAGFTHQQIGFVIRGHDAVAGGMITDTSGAKDSRGAVAGMIEGGMIGGVLAAAIALLIPPLEPIIVGGILASFFGGAIAGTAIGGILGALQGLGISEDEARFYERKFHEGRAIVAVRAANRAVEASQIMRRFGAEHVHCEPTSPIETGGTFSTP